MMPEKIYERENLEILANGEVVIYISEDGLPSAEALVPAPMMSEIEREKVINKAIDSAYMGGWFVKAQKRIRNDAFDRGKEKTTTQLSLRTCRTKDEAEMVIGKVRSILLGQLERSGG